MSIKMIRIDDRLIHGQVVAAWSKVLGIERILVIDDDTAKDIFLSDVMKMVAPSNVELAIITEDKIADVVTKYDQDNVNTFILAKYPYVMKKVFDSDISFKELDLGGMCARPNRTKLYKQISASPEEVETLGEIKNMGVKVYFRVTPDDKEIIFE